MREIKFRGKSLETGEWIFGDLIENQGRFFIYKASSETTFKDDDDGQIVLVAKEVDQKTVGQYTDLKDRDGKEICEGDFLSAGKEDGIYCVTFKQGMFYASVHECQNNIFGGYPLWFLLDAMGNPKQEFAIIGNIHDNLELLKGGKQ